MAPYPDLLHHSGKPGCAASPKALMVCVCNLCEACQTGIVMTS